MQAATSPDANPSEALQASSYADLLTPIPNALALLKAVDAVRVQELAAESMDGVQTAQYYPYYPYPPPYYLAPTITIIITIITIATTAPITIIITTIIIMVPLSAFQGWVGCWFGDERIDLQAQARDRHAS